MDYALVASLPTWHAHNGIPVPHSSVYSGQQLRSCQHFWESEWDSLGDSPYMHACVQIDGTVVRAFDSSRTKRHDDSVPVVTPVLKALTAHS